MTSMARRALFRSRANESPSSVQYGGPYRSDVGSLHSKTPPEKFGWSWTSMRKAVVLTGWNATALNRSLSTPYGEVAATGRHWPSSW